MSWACCSRSWCTTANVPGSAKGGKQLLTAAFAQGFAELALIWADAGYSGPAFADLGVGALVAGSSKSIKRSDTATGFVILLAVPLGGRTHLWLVDPVSAPQQGLRSAVRCANQRSLDDAAMVQLMLGRLARNPAVYL